MSDNFTHLFYIKSKHGNEYHLTSASSIITHSSKQYKPFSGVSLESGEFNDSAENKVILHGIFEKRGISIHDDLVGSSIKIVNYESNEADEIITYICTKQISENLEFRLICEPESIKLNKSLLPVFSKKCRASFCDSDCGLDIEKFKISIVASKILDNLLFSKDLDNYDNGYFANGKLLVEYKNGDKREYPVKNNFLDKIELFHVASLSIEDIKKIYLTPSCDKNIRTCCYSFNNTVNFRGEPDIPEHKIIKN